MRTLVVILLILVTLAFGACAWFYYFDTPYFLVVQPGVLYRDRFTDFRHFENAYRQRPSKTVIDVRLVNSMRTDVDVKSERAFCHQHGITYHTLPIQKKGLLLDEQLRQFVQIVSVTANQPILIIDDDGLSGGMLAAIWQKDGMGYPYEKTMASLQLFDSPESGELNDFIKRLYNKQ